MHADNTAPIVVAARQRRELTRAKAIQALRELERTGTPVTFQSVAAAATVSRSWLYNQPDIRAEIERLRPLRRRHSPWPPAAATLTATGVPNTATRVVLVRIADQPESTGLELTRPSASPTTPRSASDRCAPSATSRRLPRRGCTGTTPRGCCTGLGGSRPPSTRPSTTLRRSVTAR